MGTNPHKKRAATRARTGLRLDQGVKVRLRARTRPDVSCYVLAIMLVAYAIAAAVLTPEYVQTASMLARVYAVGYLGISPVAFLGETNFQLGLVCCALAVTAPARRTAVFQVLIAAAVGFAGSALLQAKGWSYHWYPFAAMGWLLFGAAVTAVRPRTLAILCVLLCAAAFSIAPIRAQALNPYLPAFAPIVRELGAGPTMILSNTVRASYPLLTLPDVWNASRLPVAPLLSAAILSEEREVETHLRRTVIEDFVNNQPSLLIVDTHPYGMPASFDFIEYLSKDRAFAREMHAYQVARTLLGFRFYQRQPTAGN